MKNLFFQLKLWISEPIKWKSIQMYRKSFFVLRRFGLRRVFSGPISDADRDISIIDRLFNYDFDPACHNSYVCCVCKFYTWATGYTVESWFQATDLWETFHWDFILTLWAFTRNLLRDRCRRNIYSYYPFAAAVWPLALCLISL